MIYIDNASGAPGLAKIEALDYRATTWHRKGRVSISGSRFPMDVLWDIIYVSQASRRYHFD
jgi:hypothetical protein